MQNPRISIGSLPFSRAIDAFRLCISAGLDDFTARLATAKRSTVCVVYAPLGYGKTRLLEACYHALTPSHCCLWMEGDSAVAAIDSSKSFAVPGDDRPRALFITDLTPSFVGAVEELICSYRKTDRPLRVMISSRFPLHMELARRISDLSVIGYQELTVTSDAFARDAIAPLQRRQLQELLAYTGGWPMAMRFAADYLHRLVTPDDRLRLDALDEVLRLYVGRFLFLGAPEKWRRQLTMLASLGTSLVPSHSSVLLRDILACLHESSTLSPLVRVRTAPRLLIEWNPGFQQALVGLLHPEDYESSRALNAELAASLVATGHVMDGVECASRANDDGVLAAALERAGGWRLALRNGLGYAALFERACQSSPSPPPLVQLGKIYSMLQNGRALEGIAAYDELRSRLSTSQAAEWRNRESDFLVFDLFVDIHRRRPTSSDKYVALGALLPHILANERSLAGAAITLLSAGYLAAWDFRRAARFSQMGLRLCEQHDLEYARMLLCAIGVITHCIMGDLDTAESMMDSWCASAGLIELQGSPASRSIDFAAAYLAYMSGGLDESATALEGWEEAFEGPWTDLHLHSAEMICHLTLRVAGTARARDVVERIGGMALEQGAFSIACLRWLSDEINAQGVPAERSDVGPAPAAQEDLQSAPAEAWQMLRAYRDVSAIRSLPMTETALEARLLSQTREAASRSAHGILALRLDVLQAGRAFARGEQAAARQILARHRTGTGRLLLRTILTEESDWLNMVGSAGLINHSDDAETPALVSDDPESVVPLVQLSKRERQVLGLIADGMSSKEIATELGIGLGTVKTFRIRLFRKLKVTRRSGAVAVAKLLGSVQFDEAAGGRDLAAPVPICKGTTTG